MSTTDDCDRDELVADGLATIPEGAAYLRVSRATMYELMGRGELPYCLIGRARRIPWRALREYAAQCLVGA
jgi:excisionase family DNA binding protein